MTRKSQAWRKGEGKSWGRHRSIQKALCHIDCKKQREKVAMRRKGGTREKWKMRANQDYKGHCCDVFNNHHLLHEVLRKRRKNHESG